MQLSFGGLLFQGNQGMLYKSVLAIFPLWLLTIFLGLLQHYIHTQISADLILVMLSDLYSLTQNTYSLSTAIKAHTSLGFVTLKQ